jgi:hypothetical protein
MLLKTCILSMAIVILMSCISSEEQPAPNPPNPYEGCCGVEPVEFRLGGDLIYIPNIFTPNGDATNDRFMPLFNKNTIALESMVIKASSEDNIILKSINEEETNSNPYWGWFGEVSQDSILRGKFLYEMTFRLKNTGEEKVIRGSGCSVRCYGNEKIVIAKMNQCFFPMQYSHGTGLIDPEQPLEFEIDCLKP